jgi:hypothetical protein
LTVHGEPVQGEPVWAKPPTICYLDRGLGVSLTRERVECERRCRLFKNKNYLFVKKLPVDGFFDFEAFLCIMVNLCIFWLDKRELEIILKVLQKESR